ncbi:NUDIX domain-containing protein [Nocardioides sp.]|uniref:NUDIX domain-containing protein n=1 Tax=Nocardioides sp. TaxID=35761 RepID=UPI002B2695C0|nr:NUDIX domain-containing protein [Nocardioides sp.]
MHHFASATLVDRRGWILLQERDEHPRIDPEKWGFPGGGVEDGETYEVAAYRELAEETGVALDGGLERFGRFQFFSSACGEDDEFELFAAATDRTEVECHEGRQMVFVDPAVAVDLPLTASASLVMADFLSSDLYRKLAP